MTQKFQIATLVVAFALAAGCWAEAAEPARLPDPSRAKSSGEDEVLNNANIIELLRLGLGEDVLLEKIRSSRCDFDTTVNGLLQLKRAAVPNSVIKAMVTAKSVHPLATYPTSTEGACVCQPGPNDGKDIWTTSLLSYAPGNASPGGGLANDALRVGGWGDWYFSLLQFNLTGMPTNACSALLYLYCRGVVGGGVPMFLDRVEQEWDWRTAGTGRDHERLWWADRPPVSRWRPDALPTPVAGQWYAIDLTDLYNAWQSGACHNYGVQLRPEKTSAEYFNEFWSSRYTNNPALRPKLVVRPMLGGKPTPPRAPGLFAEPMRVEAGSPSRRPPGEVVRAFYLAANTGKYSESAF